MTSCSEQNVYIKKCLNKSSVHKKCCNFSFRSQRAIVTSQFNPHLQEHMINFSPFTHYNTMLNHQTKNSSYRMCTKECNNTTFFFQCEHNGRSLALIFYEGCFPFIFFRKIKNIFNRVYVWSTNLLNDCLTGEIYHCDP